MAAPRGIELDERVAAGNAGLEGLRGQDLDERSDHKHVKITSHLESIDDFDFDRRCDFLIGTSFRCRNLGSSFSRHWSRLSSRIIVIGLAGSEVRTMIANNKSFLI